MAYDPIKYANKLMNAHDFTSETKVKLLEKMAQCLPGDLNSFQLYDSGTTAVEAGLRTCRAATGKHEFINGKGNMVPCETWDNGTMLCETEDPNTGEMFPIPSSKCGRHSFMN